MVNTVEGPDHQDPAVGEPAPVGVEQVRGAVQRDLGLAGAGPAGDERDAAGGRADGLVLLPLDGGDDVAHERTPGPAQRGEQRALTEHPQFDRRRPGPARRRRGRRPRARGR